ncbi:alpha/beta fold hydrolase [Streptomyces sp. MS1.HAVA.3]|uniref:Alpha/beta fold hydrolase n=1 Tax=Streptomyces caledonius TaxID=3134107 RepID=A0ABU8U450_9ACTN
MTVAPSAKGRVPFGEYRTWYRITGTPGGERPAVVVLHGGPGSTHDYLLSLAALADEGWPVVHYDQLGSGGSTRLPDRGADFWTVELFEAELDNLLRELGVADDYVLLGQSWGGMLAARHAARRPAGLRGLIIANSPASYLLWREEMEVLRAALPPRWTPRCAATRRRAPPTPRSTTWRCGSSTTGTCAASCPGPATTSPPSWRPWTTRRSTPR